MSEQAATRHAHFVAAGAALVKYDGPARTPEDKHALEEALREVRGSREDVEAVLSRFARRQAAR